jgi:hypothetical protein
MESVVVGVRQISSIVATGATPGAAKLAIAARKGWGVRGAAACGGVAASAGSTTLVPPAELA